MSVFFTSDLHLGHYNMAMHRGFSSVEEHDETIINNFNKIVKKREKVFFLGDVVWGNKHLVQLGRLHGIKELIIGNHDNLATSKYLTYFHKVHGIRQYKDLVLSHVPIHPEALEFRWRFNAHGHIHANTHAPDGMKDPRYFNVNVDMNGYLPLEYDEIITKLQLKGMGYG